MSAILSDIYNFSTKMEHRPAITLLRHYNQALKGQDISDFCQNVNRSTDKETHFYEGPLQDRINLDKQRHADWMQKMTEFAEIQYKDSIHDFKTNYLFGKNLSKEKRTENIDYSRINRTSYYEGNQRKYIYQNPRKSFNFQLINQSRKQFKAYTYNQDRTPFSLREIEMLGTEEFKQKFKRRINYEEMVMNQQLLDTKSPQYFEQQESDGRPTLTKYLSTKNITVFRSIKPENGMIGNENSNIEIDFLSLFQVQKKRYAFKQEFIPSNFYKEPVNQLHVIGLASGYFDLGLLRLFMDERKNKIKITERIQSQNQLEVQINQIKARIQSLKQKKAQKKNKDVHHMGTQIEKMIVDDPLRDMLFFDSEQALEKIENLVRIKEEKIKEGVEPYKVYEVVHPQLNKELLIILLTLIENEKFISISSFLTAENFEDIEGEVLTAINNNIEQLEGKRSKNGMSKMETLKYYTNHKIKMRIQYQIIKKERGAQKKMMAQQKVEEKTVPRFYNKRSRNRDEMMSNSMITEKKVSKSKSPHNRSVNADFSQKSRLVIQPDRMYKLARSAINFKNIRKPR